MGRGQVISGQESLVEKRWDAIKAEGLMQSDSFTLHVDPMVNVAGKSGDPVGSWVAR